jgi:protein SCO1
MKYPSLILLVVFLVISCTEKLPVEGSFPDTALTDHNGREFHFSELDGKVVLVSYIFTNCPDICHIIGNKINILKVKLEDKGYGDRVAYVSISIDPQNDTPEKLKMHAQHMNFDMSNWYFVTGSIGSVYKLIAEAGIFPMREEAQNNLGYVMIHRDRVSLVDKKGHIRKHYKGTTFDYDEVTKDIKSLL